MNGQKPSREGFLSFIIVASTVVTSVFCYHYLGMELAGFGNLLLGVVFLSYGLLRVLAIAESILLVEVLTLSTVTPLFFEPSLQYVAVGLVVAGAFIFGMICNRLTDPVSEETA